MRRPSEPPPSGRRLKELRLARGLTRPQLAAKAGGASQHIYLMEKRTGISTLSVAERLATALGLSLEELFGRQTGPTEYPPEVLERIDRGEHPVHALRTYCDMELNRLAEECGVSLPHMGNVERAKALCSPELLFKMAARMQISADLLGTDILARYRAALPEVPPSGRRLRQLRLQKGLTLSRFAAKTGINAGYISEIEAERGLQTLPLALSLAAALGVSLETLVGQDTGAAAYPQRVLEWIDSGIHPLRAMRWHRQYSVEELSAEAGILPSYISRMEQGTHLCLVDSLFDVAAALEISASLLARDLVTWRTVTRRRKGAEATPAPRRMSETQQFAERVRPHFERALAEKPQTYRDLVWLLKRDEVPSRWDGEWTPPRARTIVKRLGLQPPGA